MRSLDDLHRIAGRVDTAPVMDARSAVYVLDRLAASGIEVWIDGGWGVDALVGMQTRSHADLDLVVAQPDCPLVQSALEPLGLVHDTWAKPGLPARVVLCTDRGHQVDLHPIVLDEVGNGWQPLGPDAWAAYPREGLAAIGSIDGRQLRCLTPELQLRHRLGYPLGDHDRHDLRILATHYELAVPPDLCSPAVCRHGPKAARISR
jgi:lincosamide nucleotidyltransferase A/C/D/E